MWRVEYKKRFLKELSNLPEVVQIRAERDAAKSVPHASAI
jgi:hypothetical protein